jgi:UDP-glucose 4-epimerase
MQETHLVVGGFGFIGNQLIKSLLQMERSVFCVDDNSSGNFEYSVKQFKDEKNLRYLHGDISNRSIQDYIFQQLKGLNVVIWHLAANSDIQSGSNDPTLDAQKTFMSTVGVCKLLDGLDIQSINFASTSAVYGELSGDKMFDEFSTCNPISFYGIAKQASEKFLQICADKKAIPFLVFRFANIVGQPATHGVLFDLINKIKSDADVLEVLGDGKQTKSYLHVENLIEMMFALWSKNESGIFNLGPGDHGITVNEIVNTLVAHMKHPIPIKYGETARGWDGDAVKVLMSTSKFQAVSNVSKTTSSSSIHRAIHDISQQLGFQTICPVDNSTAG